MSKLTMAAGNDRDTKYRQNDVPAFPDDLPVIVKVG